MRRTRTLCRSRSRRSSVFVSRAHLNPKLVTSLESRDAGGTTNIRNVKSKHWTRWLGVENRCVVPFNSFSEFGRTEGGDIWFALGETRPLACFAGIWATWTSARKVKEGETTNDIFAFLTTEPNAEVGAIHPKAMPVILTTPDEVDTTRRGALCVVCPADP